MTGREITVNARKYDRSIRRSWSIGLVSESDELIVGVGRFESDVVHNDLGPIAAGTVSFEHFWTDRWYNIFRFHTPDGRLHSYYCNIAMPARLSGDVLDFVDLDIDVVVWPDGRVDVLDRDDFERNQVKYQYSPETIARAETGLDEVLGLIREGDLPK